jgi:peptidoglycan hydrolase-like protein with peptidoglycan-binding domain
MSIDSVAYRVFESHSPYDNEISLPEEVWQDELRRRRQVSRRRQTSPARKRSSPRRPVVNSGRRRPRRPTRPPRRPRRRIVVVGQRAVQPPPPEQGTEYLRWVQSALNKILGRQLLVNGIAGPETRDAIREFQNRHGLPVSGFVGPKTEQALSANLADQTAPAGVDDGDREPASNQSSSELELLEGEWQREINNRSRLYIRWVQQGLNKILGLRLAEDGIMGTQTRSGVRSFQQKYNLAVDGVVGPQTERALIAAGAGNPPVSGAVTGAQPAIDVRSLRNNIVRLANQEWQRWQQGKIKEGDPRIRNVLSDYWQTGAGWRPNDPDWWSKHPWSAAFISWVMRKSGAGNAFNYSAAHAAYTKAAKDNRLANNSNPFKAYRTSETAPQAGDLVCKSRAGSGATYDNIRPGMATHCDIVTEVQPGRLLTIGGNVSDSVKMTPVSTDGNGRVSDPQYFAVIRLDSVSP